MKNGLPPAYLIRSEASGMPGKQRSRGKFMVAYAVAVTSALVVTLVLGAVYYQRSFDGLLTGVRQPPLVEGKVMTQSFPDLTANNVAVVNTGGAGSQAVLDYSKSMTAVYDASKKMCYLVSGIHDDMVDPKLANAFPTDKYSVDRSYSVSDKSLVPAPLQRVCAGLPVHWLQQVVSATLHNLRKRQIESLSTCVTACDTATVSVGCQTISTTLCPSLCTAISLNIAKVPIVGPLLGPVINALGLTISFDAFLSVCIDVCLTIPPLQLTPGLPAVPPCGISICNNLCVTISVSLTVSPAAPTGAPQGPAGPGPATLPAGPSGPANLPTLPAGGPVPVSLPAGGPGPVTLPAGGPGPVSLPAGGPGPVTLPAGGPGPVSLPAGGPGPVTLPAGGPGPVTLPAGGPGPVSLPAGGPGPVSLHAGGPGPVSLPAGGPGPSTVPSGPPSAGSSTLPSVG